MNSKQILSPRVQLAVVSCASAFKDLPSLPVDIRREWVGTVFLAVVRVDAVRIERDLIASVNGS